MDRFRLLRRAPARHRGGSDMPDTPTDLPVAQQLRERALRLLRMSDEFPDQDIRVLMRNQAAELNAKADALERKG
jgi:hypothetical protein